jgi:glycosyltransferase involved in cell wall biosynthesis
MPAGAGEVAELGRRRGRYAAALVGAPRRAAAVVGGARERPQAGVVAGAAVIDGGVRDVGDSAAGAAQAEQPLLLVAVAAERGVERPEALERATANREVGAPDHLGLAVLGAEVERRDRRRLAATAARRRTLETGADRASERIGIGVPLHARRERGEPAGRRPDVVVEERDDRAGRGGDAGVAARVEASGSGRGQDAYAVAGGDRDGVVGRPVVDDQQLVRGRLLLLAQRRERHVEVLRSVARRHDDGDGRHGHRAGRLAVVSSAPRVLVVHNRYRIVGGEERAVDLQLRALEAAGVEHSLLERRSVDAGRVQAAGGLLRGGERPAAVGDAVRAARATVVHAHNTLPLIGPKGLSAARSAGAAVVLHLHNVRVFCATGFGERDGGPCRRCRGRNTLPGLVLNCRRSLPEAVTYAVGLATHQPRLLAAVDRFVAPSAAARDELAARGLPAERVDVLHHYLPDEAFAERSRAGEGAYALVASRLSPEKGIEDAVIACARAHAPLRVAGEGPERARLERLTSEIVERGGRPPDVTFLGRLPAAEVRRELAGAAMVLMPSRYHEFSPYSALEAMAQGVPVVATAMGGLPELLGDGRCTRPGDRDLFAERVATVWKDAGLRAAEGDAALGRARENHSRERYTEDLLDLYARIAR